MGEMAQAHDRLTPEERYRQWKNSPYDAKIPPEIYKLLLAQHKIEEVRASEG